MQVSTRATVVRLLIFLPRLFIFHAVLVALIFQPSISTEPPVFQNLVRPVAFRLWILLNLVPFILLRNNRHFFDYCVLYAACIGIFYYEAVEKEGLRFFSNTLSLRDLLIVLTLLLAVLYRRFYHLWSEPEQA